MMNRRDVLAYGAAAAALSNAPASAAELVRPAPARLETRLFNFKDDVADERVQDITSRLKSAAKSEGVVGILVGRNFIPTPFPTRFEWLYMIQFDAAAAHPGVAGYDRFSLARDELSSICRNEVECDLNCVLPARFVDAAAAKVRHTVMFDFKPDATAEARDRNVAAIRGMGTLPMVQQYIVQRNETFMAGSTQMEWQVIGDFASVADYKAYSNAPVHLAIRGDFTAHTSRVAFLDVAL